MYVFKIALCVVIIYFLQSLAESKFRNRNFSANIRNISFNSSATTSCACLNSSQFLNVLNKTGNELVKQLKRCGKIKLQKTVSILFQSICEYSCDLASFSRACTNELHPFLNEEARENFTYTSWNIFIKNLDTANINYDKLNNPCVLYGYTYFLFTSLSQYSKNVLYLFQTPFCPLQDYSCSESSYLWKAIPQK